MSRWLLVCAVSLFAGPVWAAETPPFEAGFRRFTLSYSPGEGESARERAGMLWYPTQAAAARFDYRWQLGSVAKDAEVAPGRHPLIVFSHGFLGGADQVIFLLEELARQGYLVAAVDHADATRGKRGKPIGVPNFADAKSWDDTKFRDRGDDLRALIDLLLKWNGDRQEFLHEHVEPDAIGAAGHSLGGYTVFGIAGAWPTWHDKRVRAVCLYSPYTMPFITQGKPESVSAPVMFQGGTWDWGITPFIKPVYRQLSSPRYLLVLKHETHFGWTNLASLGRMTTECIQQGNPELITRYSVSFFDRHLRGKESSLLTDENSRLDSFEFHPRQNPR